MSAHSIVRTKPQAVHPWWQRIAVGLALVLALPLTAQRRELPWPTGLGKKEALIGHIGAIDKDQMLVRSLDYGEVLFWVDQRTVVRVDKFLLTLEDLRVGDPVAVRLKKIKGRGPYAKQILPHPDVRARKLAGETGPSELPVAGGHGGFIPPQDSARPPAAPPVTPGTGATGATGGPASADARPGFPALPEGASGVIGTVVTAAADLLEVRDTKDQPQKVVLTGITLIKRAGSDSILRSVESGDRVAIVGDRMDSGEWIAREVLVQRSTTPESTQLEGRPASKAEEVSPGGVVRLSGVITALDTTPGNEQIRLRTEKGERRVLLTGGTAIRRMGTRSNLASLKVGDTVRVMGDVLQGSLMVAREVTVTKLAGS